MEFTFRRRRSDNTHDKRKKDFPIELFVIPGGRGSDFTHPMSLEEDKFLSGHYLGEGKSTRREPIFQPHILRLID